MLSAGIVGLPNVGKSTLFNAVTRTRKAQAANYPFCTIDPNVGVVTVPDPRLDVLAKLSHSQKIVPAAIEFVDIAGLVKGASAGEGLGNQFLSHIREVNAIVQVVRCFENGDIHHVSGTIDPVRDIEVINTELILADLASLQKRRDRLQKEVRAGSKTAKAEIAVIEKLLPHLDAGKPAITLELTRRRKDRWRASSSSSPRSRRSSPATSPKPISPRSRRPMTATPAAATRARGGGLRARAFRHGSGRDQRADRKRTGRSDAKRKRPNICAISASTDSGVGALIRAVYHLLGLRTYLTTGEKETRAWTIRDGDKAPAAAGVIHTDFERGFIAAETVHFDDLVSLGSFAKAREAGKLRIEGKEYVVKDGDVVEFRFNV